VTNINLIKKIGERINPPTSLKEQIAHTIFRLDEQKDKLDHMTKKLEQKDRELFHKCIESQLSKDNTRATVYANECVEVRKIAKIVLTSQISLERVILRLQTIESLGEVLGQVYPVINVVRETKDRITNVIPEVAQELEQVNGMLTDLSLEAGEIEENQATFDMASEDAIKVLKESGVIAEEIMKEKFPEPKFSLEAEKKDKLSTRVILEGGESPENLENLIYNYIRDNDGRLIFSRCAEDVGISIHTIKKTVNKLIDQGKIEIQ
jgi:division protein CdvB (Snf7/Vps24/ESCRT-III family)